MAVQVARDEKKIEWFDQRRSQDCVLLVRDGREPWERGWVLMRLGPGDGFLSVQFDLWVGVRIMMSFRAHSDKHPNFSIETFAISSKNSFFSLNVDPFDFLSCLKNGRVHERKQ